MKMVYKYWFWVPTVKRKFKDGTEMIEPRGVDMAKGKVLWYTPDRQYAIVETKSTYYFKRRYATLLRVKIELKEV